MLSFLWLRGLIGRRSGRLAVAAAGVAVTVALLATINLFVATSAASMTRQAIARVPVDWQIQVDADADVAALTAALGQSTTYQALARIGYADVDGLSASTNATVQATGPGKVLGLGPEYTQLFPSEIRLLTGSLDGALIAQQTAANLHVSVGDTVTIHRQGLAPVTVQIDGVVDLPQADSLFQSIGGTAVAPQAPPDNVLLLPADQWHALFDAQGTTRPGSVHTQIHVRLGRDLPFDPQAAYAAVQQRAHNFEARVAGSAIVGDNVGARLLGVLADALYARVLFVFLGLPGIVLAALLTIAVAASGADRRRREHSLLRVRGASTTHILRLASLEGLAIGIVGVVAGLLVTALAGAAFGLTSTGVESWVWVLLAALIGLALATGAVLVPAWRQANASAWGGLHRAVSRDRSPLWQRLYLDGILLATSAVVFLQTAGAGYQVVLAPEGVAQSSVAYQACLAPLGLWLGGGLLAVRLLDRGLAYGRRPLAWLARPLAGGLAGAVSAFVRRQRLLITRNAVLVALAVSFATSTAVFNTTYNAQTRIDAELTNGADVTISGPIASNAGGLIDELAALPGVEAVQVMQHRSAYVGADLQDLYGIDPVHVGEATTLSNAYFASGNARATLAALAAQPDGVLVSAETASDYQLQPGDTVNLRLLSGQDQQYHAVPFRFAGIVREFPTAPKDSFLVANSSYILQQTASSAAEVVLMRTRGDPSVVATNARELTGTLAGVRVTELGLARDALSSSLTAIDLRGLTRLELVFAVILLAAAGGLIPGLGLIERQRSFAILSALGARTRQLGMFIWAESLLTCVGGSVIGLALGFGMAQMLVLLLTGVFDPAPESLSVPWTYLAMLVCAGGLTMALAVTTALAYTRGSPVNALRDL